MCAGSLGPGCRILVIFATCFQVYGAHGCHLACLVPLFLRPGEPWDDSGTILGHWRALGRTLLGPGLDFIDFLLIWGTHSESLFGTFGQKKEFVSYLFPGFFFCVGSKFWVFESGKTCIWHRRNCKNQLL